MKFSLNKKIFLMINLILVIVFVLLFIMNTMFLGKYYLTYKKAQVIRVAKELHHNNFEDLKGIAEYNNLRVSILHEMEVTMELNRFERGPFREPPQSSIIKEQPQSILVEELDKNTKLITFKGTRKSSKEMMILLVEKLDVDKYLVIYSPIYSMGESIRISTNFIFYVIVIAIILSIIFSIFISRKISKPILEISNLAKQIADLDFSQKITFKSNDELGVLARSINSMSDKLKLAIDDFQTTNERLNLEIQKDKEIDKMRREFISNVNHELKTPIALIKGFSEGLKDNIASEEDKEYYLDVIIEECDNMDNLVKKLLKLSKYESEFELEKSEFNIKELINDILKRYRFDIHEKKLTVSLFVDKKFLLISDYKEIRVVIDNFIRNAITYTNNGNKISIRCEQQENRAVFSIANPHKQISAEDLEKLWLPFEKEDKARTRKYGGTGLGLSIIRSILIKHDFNYGATYENGNIKFYFYDET